MKINLSLLVVLGLLISACSTNKEIVQKENLLNEPETVDLDQSELLLSYMAGSYNSAEQEANDSSYYNISLHMYPIWEGIYEGVHYLYVEQAMNSMQDKPYRQRVYQVAYLGNGFYESAVFTLPEQEAYVGKYNSPDAFKQISPKDLVIRDGCAVILEHKGNMFRGSTIEDRCKSSLRGATYATSKVKIYPDRVESWDQGFDKDGNQVWGAVKGGYVFKKIKTNE